VTNGGGYVGSGGGCGSCCEASTACCEQKECFLHKLLAKFKKNDCGCQPTCDTCDTGCKVGFLDKLKAKFHKNDCGCDTGSSCGSCADACDPCAKKECFLTRILNKFKKNDCCQPSCGCDSGYATSGGNGCASCGNGGGAIAPAPVYAAPAHGGAPAPMPKVGEPIPAPTTPPAQPLPKGQTSIQIIPQHGAPTLDATPTTARPEIKEPF
jgi:hypothetical protein